MQPTRRTSCASARPCRTPPAPCCHWSTARSCSANEPSVHDPARSRYGPAATVRRRAARASARVLARSPRTRRRAASTSTVAASIPSRKVASPFSDVERVALDLQRQRGQPLPVAHDVTTVHGSTVALDHQPGLPVGIGVDEGGGGLGGAEHDQPRVRRVADRAAITIRPVAVELGDQGEVRLAVRRAPLGHVRHVLVLQDCRVSGTQGAPTQGYCRAHGHVARHTRAASRARRACPGSAAPRADRAPGSPSASSRRSSSAVHDEFGLESLLFLARRLDVHRQRASSGWLRRPENAAAR